MSPTRPPPPPAARSELLDALPGIAHGFFGRVGGVSSGALESLNAGEAVGDDPARLAENLRLITAALGLPAAALIWLRQVHGAGLAEVEQELADALRGAEGDALLTAEAGLAMAVKTADCVPSLVASADGALVAAVHTGWRGLAAGLIATTVAAFAARGQPGSALRVAIGPHIGPCCYEVGPEVVDALSPDARVERAGRLHADLGAEARAQWLAAGVAAEMIEQVGPCVACDAAGYFSHRRDRGKTGRQLAVIARMP